MATKHVRRRSPSVTVEMQIKIRLTHHLPSTRTAAVKQYKMETVLERTQRHRHPRTLSVGR